jgi:arabinan endo-1,5-alpha-L-arabinosidase
MIRAACALLAAALAASAAAKEPALLTLTGDVEGVHDPVIAKDGPAYYVFCTGRAPGGRGLIPIRRSTDMRAWTLAGGVFERMPEWAAKEVPKARDIWAPDISFFNGKFHLYYAVSSFGSRNSAIGLATNATLDPNSPKYKWVDEGMVLRSHEETDDWNAIDPNLFLDGKRGAWLNWGSFWGGIKMRRVDPATGKLAATDAQLLSLASRPRAEPIGGSVEAPYLIRHGSYYYLFVSFDRCCRGANSTYNVVVGRARKVEGPYLDRSGKPMAEGGGTLVIAAQTSSWRGPGHEAVFTEAGVDYLLFHAYDAKTGRPSLRVSTMVWEGGWPRVAALP